MSNEKYDSDMLSSFLYSLNKLYRQPMFDYIPNQLVYYITIKSNKFIIGKSKIISKFSVTNNEVLASMNLPVYQEDSNYTHMYYIKGKKKPVMQCQLSTSKNVCEEFVKYLNRKYSNYYMYIMKTISSYIYNLDYYKQYRKTSIDKNNNLLTIGYGSITELSPDATLVYSPTYLFDQLIHGEFELDDIFTKSLYNDEPVNDTNQVISLISSILPSDIEHHMNKYNEINIKYIDDNKLFVAGLGVIAGEHSVTIFGYGKTLTQSLQNLCYIVKTIQNK